MLGVFILKVLVLLEGDIPEIVILLELYMLEIFI